MHHVLHECVVGSSILSSTYEHVPINHRGVGIDFLLQSCCCWCYVIQPVHHVLHECVVGCPILSSMHEHVLINHRGVGIAIYCNHVVLGASHPTCISFIACMCCRMSNSIKHIGHVPMYHSIVLDCTRSYTLCALNSHHRVRCSSGSKQLANHHSHVTNTPCKAPQKAVEGATALYPLGASAP